MLTYITLFKYIYLFAPIQASQFALSKQFLQVAKNFNNTYCKQLLSDT